MGKEEKKMIDVISVVSNKDDAIANGALPLQFISSITFQGCEISFAVQHRNVTTSLVVS
jgi:hypothetical protein